jgi:3-hydroxyisobutyrate dehydrogenase-like beta-hydroxyacid dehydrogenase
MTSITLGIVGYGEVGKIFSKGLQGQQGIDGICAWDLNFAAPASAEAERAQADANGVRPMQGMAGLCEQATLIMSAVTASNTLAVAEEAARHLRPGTVFLDLNSASPGTKQQCARAIDGAGGRYVEAGVMTSVPPYGIAVPMLLGGSHAEALAQSLVGWGLNARVVAAEIGVASAIKMCRSIMIKGMEALVIESYSTARHYGVESHVLPTLEETFPQIDWARTGAYFFSRVAQHGKRRAEEMRESARTVQEAGFPPLMAAAIAEKHDWVAAHARDGAFRDMPADAPWQAWADRLMERKL